MVVLLSVRDWWWREARELHLVGGEQKSKGEEGLQIMSREPRANRQCSDGVALATAIWA